MSRSAWTDEQKEAARLKREAKKLGAAPVAPSIPQDDKMAQLSQKVDKLFDVVERVVQMVTQPQTQQPQTNLPEDISTSFTPKWRKIIDTYLGRDFKVEVLEGGHGGFALKIFLPPHLDRRTGPKDDPNPDVSVASPIHPASIEADVELWCKRIAENIKKYHPTFQPN